MCEHGASILCVLLLILSLRKPVTSLTSNRKCTDVLYCISRRFPFVFPREYRKIYRGPGFHAVVWFGSSPTPSPLYTLSKLSLLVFLCRRSSLLRGGGGVGKIIWPRESLALFISSDTLWFYPSGTGGRLEADPLSVHLLETGWNSARPMLPRSWIPWIPCRIAAVTTAALIRLFY